ncbi:MAG: putative cytokinetic ring protein SteA, partial [Caulobacteraceae bacterium]
MKVQGRIKVSKKTKTLIDSLHPGDIAVISHDDIDELAAAALSSTGIKTVINAGRSMTGRFLSLGTKMLLEHGIRVIDISLPIGSFKDKDLVTVINQDIIIRNKLYKGVCTIVNSEYIRSRISESRLNEASQTSNFIENTILYAKEDKEKIISFSGFPRLNTKLKGRHVLVVARNTDSEEEIKALRSYIVRCNPVLMGVDGGADVLLN